MIASLGGVFLYSDNPQMLANWYKDKLGLEFESSEDREAFYIYFPYREENKTRHMVFSILFSLHRPFVEGKVFTINLRVKDMDETVNRLKEQGVEISGPAIHNQGKFVWINDLEGNYLELWED